MAISLMSMLQSEYQTPDIFPLYFAKNWAEILFWQIQFFSLFGSNTYPKAYTSASFVYGDDVTKRGGSVTIVQRISGAT